MKNLLDKHSFDFPPDDLIPTLTRSYFSWYNTYLPLLHRPTFDRAVSEGLHLRDQGFASVLLLVCALGSRFSDDPRVLIPEYDDCHSAGWHWFHQASSAFQLVNYAPPRLYDLQITCVSAASSEGVGKLNSLEARIALPPRFVVSVHVLACSRGRPSPRDGTRCSQAQDIRCWSVSSP